MAKRFIGKLPLAAVLVGIALSSAGCASMKKAFTTVMDLFTPSVVYKETKTSEMLLNGANDILTANPDGYAAAQFRTLFTRKFPGLKWEKNTETQVEFTYKGAKFLMSVSNVPQQRGNDMYYFWVNANRCSELVPNENKKKKEK
ncbi:MAG: hypothetical protein LBC77_00415 [Spirochaetaceae bacterium]|nr:hypothetical protein [Spirochaetaceae bacterium]